MSPHVIFMCSLLAVTCSVSQLRFSSQKWPSVDTSCSVLDESLNQAECSAAVLPSFLYFRYRKRYLKRRLLYSMNHPGSYNPCVITNQEVHMVNGNIDRPGSSENQKTFCHCRRPKFQNFTGGIPLDPPSKSSRFALASPPNHKIAPRSLNT